MGETVPQDTGPSRPHVCIRGWMGGGPAGKAVPVVTTRGAAVCGSAGALSGPARKGCSGKRVAGEPTMVSSSLCERHVTHFGLSELP